MPTADASAESGRAPSVVLWPPGMEPEGAPVYSWNALDMPVPPEAVWPWLVRASLWPTWYSNAWRVRIEGGSADLAPGVRFTWVTFGVPVSTRVTEWQPGERLAWSASALGARGHHGWVIERTPEGCRVVTEETQRGALPSLGRYLLRPGLLHFHQRWLEGLARVAASGAPPESDPR